MLAFWAGSVTGATATKNPSKTPTSVPKNLGVGPGTLSSGLIRDLLLDLLELILMEEAKDASHSKMLTTSKAERNMLINIKEITEPVHHNGFSFHLHNYSYLP